MTEIVNYYAKNEGNFFEVAGPGSFNDPDMVCTFYNSLTNRAGTIHYFLYRYVSRYLCHNMIGIMMIIFFR